MKEAFKRLKILPEGWPDTCRRQSSKLRHCLPTKGPCWMPHSAKPSSLQGMKSKKPLLSLAKFAGFESIESGLERSARRWSIR